jgi:predicted aconitase
MNLSAEQREMLAGGRGRSLQTAMRMLVAVGRAYGATGFVPAASAHIGMSVTSLGDAGVDLLEECAAEGLRFMIPTTTNVLSVDRRHPGGQANGQAALQMRALAAVSAMGAQANCSCNPFSQGHLPKAGQSVAWSESATAPYVNAILGARTNREGATALAAALTGVTPRYGMHLENERRPAELFEVDAPLAELHSYHLLAAAICRRGRGEVPAITGLRGPIAADLLFGFCAAFATYSNRAMFHMVGVTPEAADLGTLFPRGAPPAIRITAEDLQGELQRMRGCEPREAALVVIGCPHASLAQLQALRDLSQGKRVRAGRRVLVHTNAAIIGAASGSGLLQELTAAGLEVSADTCVYVGLAQYPAGTTLVTDSAKMAFLMTSRGLRTAVAGTRECIEAATGG